MRGRINFEQYQKKEKPKDAVPANEIRVTSVGSISSYVSDAARLFEEGHKSISIRGIGQAMPNAVQTGEILKRRIKGLHQVTLIGKQEIIDEWCKLDVD